MATEQKNLSDVLKNISKKYGDNVVKRGVDSLDVDGILLHLILQFMVVYLKVEL